MLYNAWSRLLRALRRRRSLSQRVAAARAGVTLTTWWRWEKGRYLPRPDQLDGIAKALGRTPDELGLEYSRLLYRHYCLRNGAGKTGPESTTPRGRELRRERKRSNPCFD